MMFLGSKVLFTVLLTLAVSASPVVINDNLIRLPFTRHLNTSLGAGHILEVDQARAAAMRAHGRGNSAGTLSKNAIFNLGIQNQAVTYVASIGIGTPQTTYSLLIDSGSSNTWVGANKPYVKTNSSVQTANKVAVTYGSGFFSGIEFNDTFRLATGLVIPQQSIGVATVSEGFAPLDGVLGIGPVDLTIGTLSPAIQQAIPTVTDNSFSKGLIDANGVAISFEPTTSEIANNGELTFGGVDDSKFTGTISFTPITTTSPASDFWGFDQTITYGTAGTLILQQTAGIVDTGTTLMLIATDALSVYKKLTGAQPDTATSLLKLTPAQFANLESLFFTINAVIYEFTANAQAWPRSLNSAIGGNSISVYLIVGDIGSNAGSGLDFINGFVWLERFYAVLCTQNKQIGFATTPFTDATTN